MVIVIAAAWCSLIVSLPTKRATRRVWRALKANGCITLRNGPYLLPAEEDRVRMLRELADELARGSAAHGSRKTLKEFCQWEPTPYAAITRADRQDTRTVIGEDGGHRPQ